MNNKVKEMKAKNNSILIKTDKSLTVKNLVDEYPELELEYLSRLTGWGVFKLKESKSVGKSDNKNNKLINIKNSLDNSNIVNDFNMIVDLEPKDGEITKIETHKEPSNNTKFELIGHSKNTYAKGDLLITLVD